MYLSDPDETSNAIIHLLSTSSRIKINKRCFTVDYLVEINDENGGWKPFHRSSIFRIFSRNEYPMMLQNNILRQSVD